MTYTHRHKYNCLTALCLGLPGWAGTRRNLHPLTPTRKKKKNLHRQQVHCVEPILFMALWATKGCQTQLSHHTTKVGRMDGSNYWPVPLTNYWSVCRQSRSPYLPGTVTQNSLHTLSTSSIIALRLLHVMMQRKNKGRHTTICMPDYRCPHLHYPPIFMPNALYAATLPIYSGLGETSNNAGLHTR